MANKPVPVGIARTRPRFDGESPTFSVGYGDGYGMYIYPP